MRGLCLNFQELFKNYIFTSGSCDFEQDSFWEWRQVHDGHDDFDWSINSGETSSKRTGPRFDHTIRSKQGSILVLRSLRTFILMIILVNFIRF